MCEHQDEAKSRILEFVEDQMEELREAHGGGFRGDSAIMLLNCALVAWAFAGLPPEACVLIMKRMVAQVEQAHESGATFVPMSKRVM